MANPTCSNGSREDSALDPGFEAHLGNTSNSTLHISKGHKDPDSCSVLLRLQNGNYRDLNRTPAATSSVALLPSDCLHPSSQQHRCGSQVHPYMLTGPCGAPEGPCPRQGTVRGLSRLWAPREQAAVPPEHTSPAGSTARAQQALEISGSQISLRLFVPPFNI